MGNGRTAKPRDATSTAAADGRAGEMGKGRGTPAKRQMPYARHIGVEIIIGLDPPDGSGTDTVAAKDNAIEAWELWRRNPENKNFRILELKFEFITEGKVALHILYSE